jgi:hypothetical protein
VGFSAESIWSFVMVLRWTCHCVREYGRRWVRFFHFEMGNERKSHKLDESVIRRYLSVQATPHASESTAINWRKYVRLLINFSCQQTNFGNVHKISYFEYFVDVYKIRRPGLESNSQFHLCVEPKLRYV